MGLDTIDKNIDKKVDEKGKLTFAEKMKKKQKEKKANEKAARNPYNILKRYLIFLSIPIIFILFDAYLIIAGSSMNENTLNSLNAFNFYIYGTYIYVFLFPLIILQELLVYINVYLPMDYILNVEPDTFINYNFLTVNYNDFSNNLHNLLDSKYYYLETFEGDDNSSLQNNFILFIIISLLKLYVLGYFIFFVFSQILSNVLGISVNKYAEIYDKYKKYAYKTGKNMKDIEEKKKNANKYRKLLLSEKGEKIDYLTIYKDSFEKRNAVFCGIFGAKLYKDEPRKYDFYKSVNEVFNANIPNKYYNIINYMSEVDKKILGVEAIPYEDTYTQKEWKEDDFINFLKIFDDNTKKFIVPTLLTTLRKYRTFDVHNLIYLTFNHHLLKLNETFSKEELQKIKRISKDAYKIINSRDASNQDSIGVSIDIRYPFLFSINQIDELELIRENTKEIILGMRLKYLNIEEMKVYNNDSESINETAKEYFDTDYENYINTIMKYTKLFFEISSKKYLWLNGEVGKQFLSIFEKIIYLNFNTNYWMDNYTSLNSSHFKSLYMMEDSLTKEEEETLNIYIKESKENKSEEDKKYEIDVYDERISFLKYKNIGFFRIIDLSTKITGIIEDDLEIKSFLSEFLSFYRKLTNKLDKGDM